jgi:hypothetical protein
MTIPCGEIRRTGARHDLDQGERNHSDRWLGFDRLVDAFSYRPVRLSHDYDQRVSQQAVQDTRSIGEVPKSRAGPKTCFAPEAKKWQNVVKWPRQVRQDQIHIAAKNPFCAQIRAFQQLDQ